MKLRRRHLFGKSTKIATITFDKTISNPSNITPSGDTGVITALLAEWGRYLVTASKPGEVVMCRLNNENSNFYHDGSPAKLDGSEGDVMVYKPEFYYKHTIVDANKFSYSISKKQIDATWIHSPESLIGAYKAVMTNNKLYSCSGVAPAVNQNIRVFESRAAASHGRKIKKSIFVAAYKSPIFSIVRSSLIFMGDPVRPSLNRLPLS